MFQNKIGLSCCRCRKTTPVVQRSPSTVTETALYRGLAPQVWATTEPLIARTSCAHRAAGELCTRYVNKASFTCQGTCRIDDMRVPSAQSLQLCFSFILNMGWQTLPNIHLCSHADLLLGQETNFGFRPQWYLS